MSLLFNPFQIVREYLDIQLNIKPIISKNIKYKNIHAGKRCFIIGNGSSLKQMDLSILKKEITFGMNAFWKHPIISKSWQPKYYCLADPLFFDDYSDGFNSIKEFFTGLRKKIYTSILFVPLSGKDVIGKNKLLPINKVNFIFFNKALWTEQANKVDLTSSVPSVQSVAQLAIEIAIYMGCNPIYLLGMDHDWLAHRGMDRHFYSDETIKGHPGLISDLSKTTYKSELESCLRLWQGYESLLTIANHTNIRIINATRGGFLDVFERATIEEIIDK